VYNQTVDIDYYGKFTVYSDLFGITAIKVNQDIPDVTCIITEKCVDQLKQYFDKTLTKFDVQISLPNATDFQLSVWRYLQKIPFGTTVSYQQIANHLKNPKAVRAVGLANGQNPIPIVIPCHRVIGSNGKLTGYALGLELKRKLLDLESKQIHLPF